SGPQRNSISSRKRPSGKFQHSCQGYLFAHNAPSISKRLAADHYAVLHPNVDAPFVDAADVVSRLLPYHVFLQPRRDLEQCLPKAPDIKMEIAETKFALKCFKRRKAIEDRFRRLQIRAGKRRAPLDQQLLLEQNVLEADRADLTSLTAQVREARAELDKIEKEKRSAAAAAATHRQPAYYAHPSTPVNSSPFYRPYAYTYPYSLHPNPAFSAPAVMTVQASPQSPTAASQGQASPSNSPLPVQFPVALLPALNSLGIVPVPASGLVAGSPMPPVILKGTNANGTVLNLEITVASLRPEQMSGLGMLLNSLVQPSAQ
ncbi:hypothetical protein FISHEDRAFT_32030, partial [Fistulina hepatica ATCC 64428]